MRRTILAASLAISFAFAGCPQALAAAAATISAIEGDVAVKADAGAEWRKASSGEGLGKGAFVMTAFESSCEISFSDGSRMAIGELSKVEISKFASELNKVDASVTLYNGKVRATVHKDVDRHTEFSVRTPVATISVRGTEKMVTSLPGLGTSVETISGIVDVRNAVGQGVTTGRGESSAVRESSARPMDAASLIRESSRAHFKNEFMTKDEKGITLDLSLPKIEARIDETVSVIEEFVRTGDINIRWK